MHRDDRGGFTEVFQDHWKTGLKPVQWSVAQNLEAAVLAAGILLCGYATISHPHP